MPEKPHDFWNLDLTKLTWSGWLLMLLTVATVLGVAVVVMLTLEALGFQRHATDWRSGRWMAVLGVGVGIAAGAGVFAGGRWLCNRLGCPILRS
jgi:hypothetical protein